MRPEISTSAYQFAHGKKPRGVGHWAFWIRPYRFAKDSASILHFVPGSKSYSDAKEEAVCIAFDHDFDFVEVAS